jgi:hypothetical protein
MKENAQVPPDQKPEKPKSRFRLGITPHIHRVVITDSIDKGRYRSYVISYYCIEGSRKQLRRATLADAKCEARADHVVATNVFGSADYPGFNLTLSGKRATEIIRAVSNSSRLPIQTESVWDWELRFYEGREYLAAIHMASGGTFMVDNEEYGNGSRTLAALGHDLVHRTTRPENR